MIKINLITKQEQEQLDKLRKIKWWSMFCIALNECQKFKLNPEESERAIRVLSAE